MGETGASTQGGNTTSETTPGGGDGFKPITSQEELNRIIGERVRRARPADYDELKAKAKRLDEIEQANKSELQKALDRATAAERERDEAQAAALRLRIAAKHGISDEDGDLFLTGTDEATLTKQAERLAQRTEDRKKRSNYVSREGTTTPGGGGDEMREFARSLFRRGN